MVLVRSVYGSRGSRGDLDCGEMTYGQTALTLTPLGPTSFAADFVSPVVISTIESMTACAFDLTDYGMLAGRVRSQTCCESIVQVSDRDFEPWNLPSPPRSPAMDDALTILPPFFMARI